MIRGIDHLVIACPDPDEAAAILESELGLAVTGGGRHPGAGSWNRIAWLADGSYLELIGIDDRELASRSPVNAAALRALESGGGLATYSLLVDDIDLTVQGLQAAGPSFGAPVHGSRTRDDGELVEWWVAFPIGRSPSTAFRSSSSTPTSVPSGGPRHWPSAPTSSTRSAPGPPARHRYRGDRSVAMGATLHAELQLDVWAVGELAVTDVGVHVLRIVPRGDLGLPVAVNLGAGVASPRTAEVLGLRFVVEPAEVHAAAPKLP